MSFHKYVCLFLIVVLCTRGRAEDRTQLPQVADGFSVSVFASDPLVRNPCAMAFDVRGRLFVGQGPQYRKPKPDSPTDRITLLTDSDSDGVADQAKTFAEGFNSIQGLAWYGDQLWVANAPDLTIVRDTDGDDVADEYRRVFGGLGNLEHALHGLNFAPDGRLYMSKGNSKGYMSADSPERYVAPAPFADLWGIDPTADTPKEPESQVFEREQYQHGYHTPSDDWGTEGGVLRCKPDGSQLEVFARGMRNMWDMSFDADFNWIGTDQDQDGGDRILNPFAGAHFGWGHPWSPHWTGANHLPSTPISGPVFDGSGTGVVSCASDFFPAKYHGAFFCADWLNRSIFVYKPKWDGATMVNMSQPEVFAKAPRGRSMGSSDGMLFDPTDIEFGPDGALWVLSWGHGYGSTIKGGQQQDQGRVYRIAAKPETERVATKSYAAKYSQPYSEWTLKELAGDLRHNVLPSRRTNAQVELVRRGQRAAEFLIGELERENRKPDATTWLLWTIAQLPADSLAADRILAEWAADRMRRPAVRIQAIRTLGYRAAQFGKPLPPVVRASLKDEQPQLRFAAIQAIHEHKAPDYVPDLWKLVAVEADRNCFYIARIALGKLESTDHLRRMLDNGSIGQRRAALLTLLEQAALTGDEVLPLRLDQDPVIAATASSFVEKVGTSDSPVLQIKADEIASANKGVRRGIQVAIDVGKIPAGLHVRYSLDGAEPTDTTGTKYAGPFHIKADAIVAASLFEGRQRMGPVVRKAFKVSEAGLAQSRNVGVYPAEVHDIHVESGRPYRASVMVPHGKAYSNRKYTWKQLPDEITGHTFLQPRNDDADVGSSGENFLSFSLRAPALVYVAHDRRIDAKPAWLKSFQRTDLRAGTRDTTYDLFVKEYAPGRVTLGGNTIDGSPAARSQYVVIVKPAALRSRAVATTIEESLLKLPAADFNRGARLFFYEASCANCHRMGQHGRALAPDLTRMGARAAPKTLAESILKPSAVIMEGFHSVSILTDSGRVYSGFIKQESGLSVELVQADGKTITVPRNKIEERTRQQVSVMPDGLAKQLSPQQVADLVRFIIDAGENPGLLVASERHGASRLLKKGSDPLEAVTKPQKTERPDRVRPLFQQPASRRYAATDEPAANAVPLTVTDPITFQDDGRSLRIRCGERDVATYFYKHDKIQRPFFAHVKAPSGIQVTRNFPPGKGDKKDHADMHPGIWMAFGDISGEDFWRNRGRVVHERFTQPPKAGAGHGSFTQRKSYQRTDGSVVCHEDFRCTIRAVKDGYLIQWDATFSNANDNEFYFGDQEEMGLGIRVATPIAEINGGTITDAADREGAKSIWSQSSASCDYSGTIDGQAIGMTILCHPSNFRPSWMHARNYGLIAANPFGRKAMRKGASSKVVVRKDETLRLRYAILIHDKKPDSAKALTEYLQLAEED